MISGIDHVNIYTAKLAETRAFWVGLLGLTDGPRPDFNFPGAWFWAGGRAIVHVNEVAEPRLAQGALDHVSLAVPNLEEALAPLANAGVPYEIRPIPNNGGRQAFLRDPNGVRVELTCRA